MEYSVRIALLIILTAGSYLNSYAQEKTIIFSEGSNYEVISPPFRSSANSVFLVGSFACPYCEAEKSAFQRWAKKHPDIKTKYVPAMMGNNYNDKFKFDILAKADSIAQIYDSNNIPKNTDDDKSWRELLTKIKPESLRTDSDIKNFFSNLELYGQSQYEKIEGSFLLHKKLGQSKRIAKRINFSELGVPIYIVNGKYTVPLRFSKSFIYDSEPRIRTKSWRNSHNVLLDIVDYLLKKEKTGSDTVLPVNLN
jgi:thiol-disulfide isomerase/thioredoxin